MSVDAAVFAVSWPGERDTGTQALESEQQFNRFLADVERRALRIAEIAVRDRDEALDLVQDAMIRLVRKYGHRGSDEWAPLFYRILQNGIRDWHRRQAVRNRVMVWFRRSNGADEPYDAVADAADPLGRTPDEELENREAMASLESAVRDLPAPDSPTMPRTSPRATSKEMWSRAVSVPRRPGNSTLRSWTLSRALGFSDAIVFRLTAVSG